ncbi:MAG TPA: hypothetical protein VGN17_10775 [Bryobacteraceae bacterium]
MNAGPSFAALVLLLPITASAGNVHGRFDTPVVDRFPDSINSRLIAIGPLPSVYPAAHGPHGAANFGDVPPGSYILEDKLGNTRVFVRVVKVNAGDTDLGTIWTGVTLCEPPDCFADSFAVPNFVRPPRVVDVCAVLQKPGGLTAPAAILVSACCKKSPASRHWWATVSGNSCQTGMHG